MLLLSLLLKMNALMIYIITRENKHISIFIIMDKPNFKGINRDINVKNMS